MTASSTAAPAAARRATGRLASLAGMALAMVGCASLPPMPVRSETRAVAFDPGTALGRKVAADAAQAPSGASGVRLLADGEEALATLISLADAAERSLDLQYYAMLDEASTRQLLDHLRAAADRGVRVRLLIDDFNTAGTDALLMRLARHEHIEVRLYNPLPAGRFSVFTKVFASLGDVPRINSRMHNKQFVADNAVAVAGGRNLGDAYFLQAKEANFVDLDLLVAGPVVRQLSAVFDRYWNSELAYPAAALIDGSAASAPLDEPDAPLPRGPDVRVPDDVRALRDAPLGLQWTAARLMSDDPDKTLAQGEPSDADIIYDDYAALLRSAARDVTVISAYFVPGDAGIALMAELRNRGVQVRVLTASLAGTDAPAVHAGYGRYREALLRLGVELYELRAVPGGPEPKRYGGVHSRTNLHAKAAVVDGRLAVVGSMNFDPRSKNLNTEMALVVRSPPLADRLNGLFERYARAGAYRLALDGPGGALRWHAADADGRDTAQSSEPDTSLWQRLLLKAMKPLAPESML